MTDVTIDANNFLRVDQAKAPFKYDPKTGVISWLDKNPARRGQPVSVSLAQLAGVQSAVSSGGSAGAQTGPASSES